MKTAFRKSLVAISTLAAIGTPMLAHAESATVTGVAVPLNTSARLDFRVTIPKVLFLRVGTGGVFGAASVGTIDLIDFVVPVANVGDASVINATAGSGNLGNGAVTALLRSNAGNVTLTANTTGALTNATADTIPWSEIAVASTASIAPFAALGNTFPHTAALPLTGASANFAPAAVAKVTNVGSTWTYTYLNSTTYPEGIYGPTANGRVTYTASVL